METKICKVCNKEKDINEFRKYKVNKENKTYYRSSCIICERKTRMESYYKNLEKNREYSRINHQKNKDKHKERISEYNKKYYKENKEKLIEKSKERYRKDKKAKNTYNAKYIKLKRKNDKIFLLKINIRRNIRDSFKRINKKKNKKTEEILGCSLENFIDYLIKTYEKNYNEKWSWEYIKNVNIDHIIPLALAKTEEDVMKLCHYTNLQLLKTEDNKKKGAKLNWRLKNER